MSKSQASFESLNERLVALALTYRDKRTPEAAQAIADAFAALDAEGVAPGLDVGERAPDFELPEATGAPVRLAERLARGAVVLSFYRGAWCPYCNMELHALQEALPAFRERGASLVAVSPQGPDDSLLLIERHHLAFDVLSDVDQVAIQAYRLQFTFPHEIREHVFPGTAAALERQQPDGEWRLPVPATFVIDPQGVIRAK
ncbi:MAG: AhpC/TSA family protein, partial [Actinobacteria bacterium]|nr:AhpC/TSA family protein [Actinomycetota bacterium]